MAFRETFASPLYICLVVVLLTGASQAYGQVPAAADQVCPLKVGAQVPGAILTQLDGASFDLTAAVSSKPTVLIFYRGGW